MGTNSEIKVLTYQEIKKLKHSNDKLQFLHVNRNRLFVKGNRNIKKPNDCKPHYSQG